MALAATLGASELLVWGVTRLGFKLGLAAGLVGLLTALGADSPEIASAMSAVLSGAHQVGVGVVLGSNLFNLAALLGLPGVMMGRIPVRRVVPLVDGTASLLFTLFAAGLITGHLTASLALIPAAVVLLVYLVLLSLRPHMIQILRPPRFVIRSLTLLSGQIHPESMVEAPMRAVKGWLPVWLVPPALLVIVAGSVVMVTTALRLGDRWQVPPVILGTVILAAVTSLPNLYAAIRLGQRNEGATLVSEAFNSNTLNLVAGLGLPSIAVGTAALTSTASSGSLVWLTGLSLLAVAMTVIRNGLTRTGGIVIILGYAGFLVFLIENTVS